MRRDSEAGFTISEILIALVIQVLVMGGVLSMLSQSTETYATTSRLGRIEEEGRRALSELSLELKMADGGTLLITQQNGSDRLDFNVPVGRDGEDVIWSAPITYQVEPSSKDANQNGVVDEGMLVRIQNGRRRFLCHYIPLGGLSIVRTGDTVSMRLDLMIADELPNRLLQISVSTSSMIRN